MSITYAGFTGFTQLEAEKDYNSRSGELRVDRYKGPLVSIKAQYEILKAQGYDVSYTPTDGDAFGIISVSAPDETVAGDAPLSESWEMDRNYLEKDIWTHPTLQTAMDSFLDSEKKSFFVADFEAILNGERFFTDENGEQQPLSYDKLKTLVTTPVAQGGFGKDWKPFQDLFRLRCKGVTNYQVIQRVLRRTRITSRFQTLKALDTGVGGMIPANNMIQAVDNYPTVKFQMPPGGHWMKVIPKVEELSSSKWKITNEYWHVDDFARELDLYSETTAID